MGLNQLQIFLGVSDLLYSIGSLRKIVQSLDQPNLPIIVWIIFLKEKLYHCIPLFRCRKKLSEYQFTSIKRPNKSLIGPLELNPTQLTFFCILAYVLHSSPRYVCLSTVQAVPTTESSPLTPPPYITMYPVISKTSLLNLLLCGAPKTNIPVQAEMRLWSLKLFL